MVNLIYEDLIGNLEELYTEIGQEAPLKNWAPDWFVKIQKSSSNDEIAKIDIHIISDGIIFDIEFIIFKSVLNVVLKYGFSIQWGHVPHPIIPLIHRWLKKTGTSKKRVIKRTKQIKEELIQSAMKPERIEGI